VSTAEQYPTVEQNWPRMYIEFADVYDRFADREWRDSPVYSAIDEIVDELGGQVIAEIGSGTGRSTLELAKYARFVVGIEPEAAMWRIASKNIERAGLTNVALVQGSADHMPLSPRSVDVAVCVMSVAFDTMQHAAERLPEIYRTVKRGGSIVVVGLPPLWYAGELAEVVLGESRTTPEDGEGRQSEVLSKLGFMHHDIDATQTFDSVEDAVAAYGFIFGRNAIQHLIENNMSSIRWRFRISYLDV